ncbi:hypothetical protein [Empedobacter falsenii]|uniref:hypothetical protein n=1 Tax=Empedobacter falsenii TaxID=343874 RepID=UPI003A80FB57
MKIKLKIKTTFEVKYLQVDARVRYWEDATVNGIEDENGDLIPCRENDSWKPLIDVDNGQIINWEQGKKAEIHYKVCDDGDYTILDIDKTFIKKVDGYVISDLVINERSSGDYIILEIDENGFIKDWSPKLKEFK